MREGGDLHEGLRTELLEPVARMCAAADVLVWRGNFRQGRFAPTVTALLCTAEDNSWDAAVTVVRAHRMPKDHRWHGHKFTRDPREGYDLDSPGEIVYEVQIKEDDDGAGGHGPRPLVAFRLFADPRAAADELILWARRASLFRTDPPVQDPDKELRRERRCFDHREASAGQARVAVGWVPDEAAADVASVDRAAVCWHFPRERSGRYQRSAVVALTSYGDARPHRRGPWLTVRADGDRLMLTMDSLIAANQKHRWDVTPWLWDRRHANTPPMTRWQVDRPEHAAPAFSALRRAAVGEALAEAGVQVDDQIGKLLGGNPNRAFRAELTETWVSSLYAGLADVAPWRLSAAYQIWREGRMALGLPTREPVVLFGLGGVGAQRKPKVALDLDDHGPVLRLIFTGSNALLPRSLWTVPADLAAHLHGWRPSVPVPAR